MIGQSFQTAGAPGSYFMPFQGQRTYMPAGYVRTTPRWQQQMTQPQFQVKVLFEYTEVHLSVTTY